MQVAVVDPCHTDMLVEIVKVAFLVHLEQHIQVQLAGHACQVAAKLPVETCRNEQYGIGPQHLGLEKLVLVNDEILAQDGNVCVRPHAGDILVVPAKVGFVGEDGKGRSPVGHILRDDLFGLCLAMNPSPRR